MKKKLVLTVLPVIFISMLTGSGLAQRPPEPEKILVKVQVVLSRYEGDRKTSSLPFTLLATANGDRASVRAGGRFPMETTTFTPAPESKPTTSYQYTEVGTNIDCAVKSADNGKFSVYLSINDTSVIERQNSQARGAAPTPSVPPTYRNFTYTNSILLKDGESKQFVAASDKVSGDVVKIDVTMNIEK
jgi:hypothetical protein